MGSKYGHSRKGKKYRNAKILSINNMLRSFVKTCKYHHNDLQAFNIENPSIS